MRWKGIIALAVLVASSAPADEFYRDFRTRDFDDASFQMAGPDADRFVEPSPDGLRIKFLDGANHEPTGITLRQSVRGDFEITAAYEIRTLDPPTTGYGVGVGLYLETTSPTKEGITLERFVVPGAGEVFATTRASMKPDGARAYVSRRFPAKATRSGQLRLTRRGARISASVAEGADTAFRMLRAVQVAPDDLAYVRLSGDTGGSTSRLEATFKELRIRTGDLPDEPPDPAPVEPAQVAGPPPITESAPAKAEAKPAPPPPESTGSWVVLAMIPIAAIAVGLVVLLRRRRLSGNSPSR